MATRQVSDFPQTTSAAIDDWIHLKTNAEVDQKLTIEDLALNLDLTGNVKPISVTLAQMVAFPNVKEGMRFQVTNNANAIYTSVLTSSVTPGYGIYQSTSNLSISFSLDLKNEGPLNPVGGAIRITPQATGVDNTFSIIDDASHDPINITGVAGGLQTIDLTHDRPNLSDVVGTTIVAPDETLVQRGIMSGGSIATNTSLVTLAKRHQFTIDWQAGAAAIANLVVDPFMDVPQRYVPTDNTLVNGAYRLIAPRTTEGLRVINPVDRLSPDAYITSISDTTFDVFPYKSVTLTCAYNGTTWAVEGNSPTMTSALAAIGVTCASVGATITITHPATLGNTSNSIVTAGPASDYFYTNILTETTTTTAIALVDDTGIPIAPANTDTFNIRLEDILWLYGRSIVDLGMIKCSPTLDFKDLSVANNFWVLGNHWSLK